MRKISFSKKFKKRLGITAIILTLIGGGGLYLLYNLGLTDIPFIPKLPDDDQIKIACVGDSVTYGYGLPNWEENSYPTVLQNKLDAKYHVMNFGVSGHCVQESSDEPYTLSESYEMSIKYDADIVVFMLGSNDSKVDNWQGKDYFKKEYLKLLNDYKDSKIILCTPSTAFYIDYYGNVSNNDEDGITTFEIQPKVIEEIADIIRDIAYQDGYPLVDINNLTEGNPQWFTVDGTHPNADGAKAIAEAVYDKLIEITH